MDPNNGRMERRVNSFIVKEIRVSLGFGRNPLQIYYASVKRNIRDKQGVAGVFGELWGVIGGGGKGE